MRIRIKLITLFVVVAFSSTFSLTANDSISDDSRYQVVSKEIIAREKASFAAWQRKDKAFYADY